MKGLCHSCLISNVDVTVDKLDSNTKCKECIGKPSTHDLNKKAKMDQFDKDRYGWGHDITTSHTIGAKFVQRE